MRLLKIVLFILLIIILQTVVFARFNLFGAVPDLALVVVIIFAILEENRTKATLFAGVVGLLQDVLSSGIYINTIIKVVVANLDKAMRRSFFGDDYFLSFAAVAVFTPITMLIQVSIYYFFFARQIGLGYIILTILLTTTYNLVMVPIFFPVIKRLIK